MAITSSSHAALERTLASLQHLRVELERLSSRGETIAGGYGDVWFATLDADTPNSMLVAVKQLRQVGDGDERARIALRLARELKIWAGLNHPNLLPLIGYYLSPDMVTAQLISPVAVHGHLGDYVAKVKPEQDRRLELLVDVATGLQYLHALQPPICHGDLKIRNVLVGEQEKAILCDFGLAKLMDDSDMPTGLTTSKVLKGSMRYCSPELFQDDEGSHTLYSDIWAWGCLAFELLTDTAPYAQAKSDSSIIRNLMDGKKPAKLESYTIPEGVKELLDKCWTIDPALRPAATECFKVVAAHTSKAATPWPVAVSDSPEELLSPATGPESVRPVAQARRTRFYKGNLGLMLVNPDESEDEKPPVSPTNEPQASGSPHASPGTHSLPHTTTTRTTAPPPHDDSAPPVHGGNSDGALRQFFHNKTRELLAANQLPPLEHPPYGLQAIIRSQTSSPTPKDVLPEPPSSAPAMVDGVQPNFTFATGESSPASSVSRSPARGPFSATALRIDTSNAAPGPAAPTNSALRRRPPLSVSPRRYPNPDPRPGKGHSSHGHSQSPGGIVDPIQEVPEDLPPPAPAYRNRKPGTSSNPSSPYNDSPIVSPGDSSSPWEIIPPRPRLRAPRSLSDLRRPTQTVGGPRPLVRSAAPSPTTPTQPKQKASSNESLPVGTRLSPPVMRHVRTTSTPTGTDLFSGGLFAGGPLSSPAKRT